MECKALISELKDTSRVEALFAGWEETLIYSCLQNVMGKIYVALLFLQENLTGN